MEISVSKAKHTPAPWRLPHFVSEESGCDCGYIFANDDRMGAVASVHFHKRECDDNPPKDEAKANARLIAAAPDLLAALKTIFDEWQAYTNPRDDGYPTDPNAVVSDAWKNGFYEKARAAISKAEPSQ